MRSLIASLVALALLTAPALALAEPIVGRATVIDGDTIEVQGTSIRLYGIDAPENGQKCQDSAGLDFDCGQAAARALGDRIGEGLVTCELRGNDRYGRTVGVCRADGTDLSAWLAEQGYAFAYRLYGTDYSVAEGQARRAGRGLWAGDFTMPWEWRQAAR